MSGHSKWNNIKRRKEKTDSQRAKVFTKMGREITVAVRDGGPDPANNGKLRDVIAKAKAANVPSDNIERIIQKAQGGDRADYENIVYEGYGPGGVAVMVDTLTDNRNRTAADIRHYFDKYGGNLGTTGCVSFMFSQKGVIVLDMEGKDQDAVMEDAIEAGADDIDFEDGAAEITAPPADLRALRETLEARGYGFISADVEYVPASYTRLDGEESLKKMATLIDLLEDNDDVQNIWHNLDNEDDLPG
jgi:YebC/PmpR family DNA-binding regulatory protein